MRCIAAITIAGAGGSAIQRPHATHWKHGIKHTAGWRNFGKCRILGN